MNQQDKPFDIKAWADKRMIARSKDPRTGRNKLEVRMKFIDGYEEMALCKYYLTKAIKNICYHFEYTTDYEKEELRFCISWIAEITQALEEVTFEDMAEVDKLINRET